jgi:hypothetical protein
MDGFPIWEEIVARKPVVEARNELARRIRGLKLPMDARFVLWTDDDAWWPPGAVGRAVEIMSKNSEIAVLFGWFSVRDAFQPPGAFGLNGRPKCGLPGPSEPVEALVCGFHWVMMRREVLEAVGDDPFNLSLKNPFWPEDYSFCERVADANLKMFCATDILVAHVDAEDGTAYLPNMRELKMRDLWLDTSIEITATTSHADERAHDDDYRAVDRDYGKESDDRFRRHSKIATEGRNLRERAREAKERGDPYAEQLELEAEQHANIWGSAIQGTINGIDIVQIKRAYKARDYGPALDKVAISLEDTLSELRSLYDPARRALQEAKYDAAAILISRADKLARERGLLIRLRDLEVFELGTLTVAPPHAIPEPPTANQVRAQIRAALENKERKSA